MYPLLVSITRHFSRYIPIFLALVFLTSCATAPPVANDIVKDGNDALFYIMAVYEGEEEKDVLKLKAAIKKIDHMLAGSVLDERNVVQAHYVRAVGYHQLVFAKSNSNDAINIEDVKKGLADFDFVLASNYSGEFHNAAYIAGGLAYRAPETADLAGPYWRKCADSQPRHFGCVNNVASSYFNGSDGLARDFQKAIDLHTLVFDSGTQYRCAGSFSGYTLAAMAVFFPNYEYRDSWTEYSSKSLEFASQMVQSQNKSNACAYTTQLLTAYVLNLANGKTKPEYLKEVLRITGSNHKKAIANIFLGNTQRDAYDTLPREEYDSNLCGNRLNLIFYALVTDETKNISRDTQAILEANPNNCEGDRDWLDALETELSLP